MTRFSHDPPVLRRITPLLVALLAIACGPSIPDELVYRVRVPAGARHPDARVLWNGTAVGPLADEVTVRVPSSVRPIDLRLSVEVPTLCGSRTVPLEFDGPLVFEDERIASEMEMYGEIGMTALDPLRDVRQVTIIVDRAASEARPVLVGSVELPAGGLAHTLIVADCAAELPVRIGDEAIGMWRPSDGTTLVAANPGCYAVRTIGYGTATSSTTSHLDLRATGQRVRALENGVPEYLFRAAPSAVWTTASGEVHSELLRDACR